MNKRAFLFGINEYNSVGKLRFARQDAEAVARALREGYDFKENEVVLCTCESSLKPMIKSNVFKELQCTEDLDLLVVGFWGHGVWRDGKRYLCLIGTDVDSLAQSAISLEELRDAIQKVPAKNVCIILDCCQSRLDIARDVEAPVLETGARDIILKTFKTTSLTQTTDQTVAILNSCSEGQRAYEWEEKGHGFFTVHLLEELEKREANIATIFKYVREETRKSTRERQSPFFECRGGSEIILPAVPLKTFFVPENPSDVKIVTNHRIGEINVTIQRIDLPQSVQPQALPPVPNDLRQFQSELAGIDQAISQLQDGTHPALESAKKAISDAQSQLDALKSKNENLWKSLNNANLRQTVTEELRKNPNRPTHEFFQYAPSKEIQQRLFEVVLWEKHVIQAQSECERVKKEYCAKCQAEIDKIEEQKKEALKWISPRIATFQTEVLMTVLGTFRNYDLLDIPTDNLDFQWDCNNKLTELLKYNLGWEFQQLFKRARELWSNNRPVVVQERERKRQVERHAIRKKWAIRGIVVGAILLGIFGLRTGQGTLGILFFLGIGYGVMAIIANLRSKKNRIAEETVESEVKPLEVNEVQGMELASQPLPVIPNPCQYEIIWKRNGFSGEIALSPDGKFLTVTCGSTGIKILDFYTGKVLQTLRGHKWLVTTVSYSPDGRFLASGSWDETVRIWNVQTGECVKTLEDHEGYVTSVSYSPDGRFLTSGCNDNTVRIWNTQTGKCVKTIEKNTDYVNSVSYSPDGRFFATGGNPVRIWNAKTGECVKTFHGHTSLVMSVSYSPDGRFLASGGSDGTVRIWNVRTGECVKTLKGYRLGIDSVSYSPDGRFLASGGMYDKNTVRIWNVQTGECVKLLKDDYGASSVSYSPDGYYFVAATNYNLIVWRVAK